MKYSKLGISLLFIALLVFIAAPDLVWIPSKLLSGQGFGVQSANPVLTKMDSVFVPSGVSGQSVFATKVTDGSVQGLALKGYECIGYVGRSGDYLELRNYCKVSNTDILGVRATGLGVRLEQELARRVDWSGVRVTSTTPNGQTSWSTNLQSVSGVSWDPSYHDDVLGLAARQGVDNTYVEAVIYDATGDAVSGQIVLFLPINDWTTPTAENEDVISPRFWTRVNVKTLTDIEYIQYNSGYKAAANNLINTGYEVLKSVTLYDKFKEKVVHYSAVGADIIKKIRVYSTSKLYCIFGKAVCAQSIVSDMDVSDLSERLLSPPNSVPSAQTFILDTVHLFPPDVQIFKGDWIAADLGGVSGWDKLLKLSLSGYGVDLGFEEWDIGDYCPSQDKFYRDAEQYKCSTSPTTTLTGGATTTTISTSGSTTTTTLPPVDSRNPLALPVSVILMVIGFGIIAVDIHMRNAKRRR